LGNKRFAEGFTLIESLVALAIFGLAAVTLLKLEGATMSSSQLLERKAIAQIVARNIAADVLTDPIAPPFGTATGTDMEAGAEWHWTRTISHMPDNRLMQVVISVGDPGGGEAASITLYRRT
jgi:general secretion pathway protein I